MEKLPKLNEAIIALVDLGYAWKIMTGEITETNTGVVFLGDCREYDPRRIIDWKPLKRVVPEFYEKAQEPSPLSNTQKKLVESNKRLREMLKSVLDECRACDDVEPRECRLEDQIKAVLTHEEASNEAQ